jgi:hypothetical protein
MRPFFCMIGRKAWQTWQWLVGDERERGIQIYIEGAAIVRIESFLTLCGSNVLLEIVQSGIVDENVTAPVLVADPRAEGSDAGLVSE